MSEYVNADSCMYACFCMWVFVKLFCSTKALNLSYALYTFPTWLLKKNKREILSMEHSTNVDVSVMHGSILGVNVCANVLIFEPLRNPFPPFSVHCICNQKCDPGHSLAFNTGINSALKWNIHGWFSRSQ